LEKKKPDRKMETGVTRETWGKENGGDRVKVTLETGGQRRQESQKKGK